MTTMVLRPSPGFSRETPLSLSSGLPELRPLSEPWVITSGMPMGPR